MPRKVWTDTTIKTAAQAEEEGLTPGIKFTTGKGPRCLLLAAGGRDGFGKTHKISTVIHT